MHEQIHTHTHTHTQNPEGVITCFPFYSKKFREGSMTSMGPELNNASF